MQESIWDLLQEVNWMLIVLTLLAGGVLSIIGDRVGMKFAKRRVTILNIRPRYTSSILTACTGMLISFVVNAPISRPIGVWIRSRGDRAKPSCSNRSKSPTVRRREPIIPRYRGQGPERRTRRQSASQRCPLVMTAT